VTHFDSFVTPAILEQVKAAQKVVKGFNINQLNSLPHVQEAIAEALKPLGKSLSELQEEHANKRSGRTIRI
jgi:hypothetical protein